MADPLHLDTQNPVDVAIDEVERKARMTVQWLLEDTPAKDGQAAFTAPPITRGNDLQFLICGQEGFGAIADDLLAAESTVDLVCWGFDPGMELVRDENEWGLRGSTYGDLLEGITSSQRKDGKPSVTVRLLIWHNVFASTFQNNMPGYTDDSHWNLNPANDAANLMRHASPYASTDRQQYCIDWWKRNLPHGNGSGTNPNLQVVLRDTHLSDSGFSFADEEDPKLDWSINPLIEVAVMGLFATHHQKPVLIDYAHEGGRKAVGYVMGLNSVTDYWDSKDHFVDTGLREQPTQASWQGEVDHEYETAYSKDQRKQADMPGKDDWNAKASKVSAGQYQSTRPYQDYACRIVGPALESVHRNFVTGWNDAAPGKWQAPLIPLPAEIPTALPDPAQQVQIVRTQPREKDKTIKKLYDQASSWARNYIYIENQYFFYPHYANRLVKERQKFCDAWNTYADKPVQQVPTLYLFIVIPHPENTGMVPRTQETLALLDSGDAMPQQKAHNDPHAADADTMSTPGPDTPPDPEGHPVIDRDSVKKLAATLGLKVSVAMLRTSNTDGRPIAGLAPGTLAYREIYIHSKLMLIDDVFVTLGSANLNQRSMAVDSEINIAATGLDHVSDLRERIFKLHSGDTISGSGKRDEVPGVFTDWKKLMKTNQKAVREGNKPMTGFLLPFEDHRETSLVVASADLPTSSPTVALS